MSRRLHYRLVDVFTDRPFAGNALAVFGDAAGLDEVEMQTLAAELNLAESSFVHDWTEAGLADGADAAVRIFTPGTELPFAGHPTLGTAWVLAQTDGRSLLRLELAVGVLEASIDRQMVTLGTTVPQVVRRIDRAMRDELARALSLDPTELRWPGADDLPAVVSCGTPYLVVPFARLEALAAIDARRAIAAVGVARKIDADLAMVAPGNAGAIVDADVHVRVMSDPTMGALEDAATGSAAVPLCAFIGIADQLRDTALGLVIEQGVEMGRPSRLETEVIFDAIGMPTAARLSGSVVPIGEGWIEI
ncbi:MAG TPA: PhzF family phenazine biosynthesis protein [Candidatus Limnocylindrales bacterium]|nr:PhzF family phenazine biosynthesis protein [Candidatus Limnocylindrales bacterium]